MPTLSRTDVNVLSANQLNHRTTQTASTPRQPSATKPLQLNVSTDLEKHPDNFFTALWPSLPGTEFSS